ncbi:methyl-accepting chemotaxis protein [Actinoplanes sp. SE50]|uniref:methyl-accepting chemotaxis protein n=1 Tax=unclassified Actinoplanes TaxID=2626549 RepID=UPI00023ED5B1|nr:MULTISPECIES: methyl-accepting chemotaxis protein [unclassified Actinoplanes]AEV83384.1 Methyl-accepting chemotaxis protein mcpA [Actinoplanes sp. SE50/110]ATO81777.1 methyl-accepting chemotaxis protein [Actinoplanes sp. SE50]SLL99185.1 methyl-accepting chemotaxis protein [Actinoplanes sp. SE50/110]
MTTLTEPPARRSFFADLGVRHKIGAIIAISVLVSLVAGILATRALSRSASAAERLYQANMTSAATLAALETIAVSTRNDLANLLISRSEADNAKYEKRVQDGFTGFASTLATYKAAGPAGDAATVAALESNWNAYRQVVENTQIANALSRNVDAYVKVRDEQTAPITDKIKAGFVALGQAESADAQKAAAGAQSTYHTNRNVILTVQVLGNLLAILIGVLVIRAVVGALSRVREVCTRLAAGDLTGQTGLTSNDETGQMGRALDTAMVNLRRTVATIDESATSLAGAADRVREVATEIAGSAERTTSQAQTVSAAAEEISRSVDTVSAGSEEMGASIREISQNAAEAAQVAGAAVDLASRTSATMNQLGESSSEIGNVIKTITAIAEQTNLLALNATIEAARAGEAGKGFAVVASEVKDLAQETARATEDISRRVEAIQADTNGAVTAIEEITRVIARISDFQTTIASAVEEQTATTAEMNRSVSEAASGTGDIAQNITGVAEAARSTSEGVERSQQTTAELTRMSGELSALVKGFRY